MASVVLSVTLESEPALDAIELLQHAFERLTHRHGDRFRDIEREIDEILTDEHTRLTGEPVNIGVDGDCTLVIPASDAVASALRRARQLGVIR